MKVVDIFIAYSHKDLSFKNELRKILRPLLHAGKASLWDDYDIEAGKDWEAEIKQRLHSAEVILLLVSPDALDSDYFYGKEVKISLERHAAGEATVVPVILRHCLWDETPLGELEVLPEKGKAITSWASQDEAFTSIARSLLQIVNKKIAEHTENQQKTEQEQTFQAAVKKADDLFKKKTWAEAHAAYLEALELHQPGFVPDSATLKQRLAQCLTEIENAAWEAARKSDALEKYLEFAEKYPQSRYAAEAKQIIAERSKPQVPPHFVFVKGGSFQMGDVFGDGHYDDEKPTHTVTLRDFYISKYAVTFDEFEAFCASAKRDKPADSGWGRGRRPAINVDWYDAVEYCNWLSQQEGLTPAYSIDKNKKDPDNKNGSDTKKWLVTFDNQADGYRLPIEAEWEYAARAALSPLEGGKGGEKEGRGGAKVRFGNGKDIADPAEINFNASEKYKQPYSEVGEYRQKTLPVDALPPNALGLHHMSGNVWEWCWDWFGADYYKKSDKETDPVGPVSGEYRVVRGGSWDSDPNVCRAACRGNRYPLNRFNNQGFRLARY